MNPGRAIRVGANAACVACALAFILLMTSGTVRSSMALIVHRAIARVRPPEIALIGDSLTRDCPWPSLTTEPLSVVNLARGGTVIRQIVTQAAEARLLGARTVLVGGGTNDLLLDRAPASRIAFDFAILMRTLAPIPRRIVTLIPYTRMPEFNRAHDEAKAVMRGVAELYGAEVIDLDALISDGGVLKPDMTTDGVHLTAKACEAWLGAAREKLASGSDERAVESTIKKSRPK